MKFPLFFFLFVFLNLTSCTFTPVLDSKRAQDPQKFILKITGTPQTDYVNYKLRKALEMHFERIQRFSPEPLVVSINVTAKFGEVVLNSKAKVLRHQGYLSAELKVTNPSIRDEKKGQLLNTMVESMTSFTVPNVEEFTILSAERGARERMIKELAETIAFEISLSRPA